MTWKELKRGSKIYIGNPVYNGENFTGYTIEPKILKKGITPEGVLEFKVENKTRRVLVSPDLLETSKPWRSNPGVIFVALEYNEAKDTASDLIHGRIIELQETAAKIYTLMRNLEENREELWNAREE